MRLIDADALERRMNERLRTLEAENGPYDHYACGYEDAIDEIEDAPTVEAVPVVRCKDCRKRRSRECPMCDYEQLWDDDEGWIDAYRDRTEDEGFCHKGAKMDGGEK